MRAPAALLVALILAASAGAAPPRNGVLVPGRSLGGLRLGMTKAEVRAAWGPTYGVCRGCLELTWYFTYRRGRPQGAGVQFHRGRVDAIFTHWQPRGWRTSSGIPIAAPIQIVTNRYGALPRTQCATYSVLTLAGRRAVTSFYIVDEEVWGFGLAAPRVGACR
jgi:hypothetical protein